MSMAVRKSSRPSAVAFGSPPGDRLQASSAPMTEVGVLYLHTAAAAFVTFCAVMALATSLNATMLVPSRMALVLVRDGLAPAWIGTISADLLVRKLDQLSLKRRRFSKASERRSARSVRSCRVAPRDASTFLPSP